MTTCPEDLLAALLVELPQTCSIVVRCGACGRNGSWTVWWLSESFRASVTVVTVIARACCRCRVRPTSALLQEGIPRGVSGTGWVARTTDIIIPPPRPRVETPEVPQIHVDWSIPNF